MLRASWVYRPKTADLSRGGKKKARESQQALAQLCQEYWYPLYAFVRLQGSDAEEAGDLTQAFFVRVLEHAYFRDVEPEAGRFRSFLLVSLKHFLSKER